MSKRKIFFADDEEKTRTLLRNILQDNGYETLEAGSGPEAMEMIKGSLPDLILMDIMMPESDGAEIVHQLQQNPKTADIPVIFLSGVAYGSGQSEILVSGRYYPALGKPFDEDQLLGKIAATLPA